MSVKDDRREFIKRMCSAAFYLAGGSVVVACGGQGGSKDEANSADSVAQGPQGVPQLGGNCDDFSKLTAADHKKRDQLGYEKVSPSKETQCQHCNLWLPPRPNETCGGCTLFNGPIEPEGTCTYWVPRQ